MFTKEQKAYIKAAIAAAVAGLMVLIGATQVQVNDLQNRVDTLEGLSNTPTPTPSVSLTPSPTTSLSPTSTPSLSPTLTPTPPPSPTATSSPSPTAPPPTPTPSPVPLPGPNPTGPGGGVFSVTCLLDHASHDDPIVFHGTPGAAHLHQFFGAKGVNANTVPSQLAGSPTTCLHTDDHAAYWAPALVLRSAPTNELTAFKPKSIFAYYQVSTGAPARAFPQGLVMVADATGDPSGKSGFSCSDQGPFAPLPYNCPQKTVGHLHFPDCWDGVHLDSANHRTHMSYSRGGNCDAAHPIRLVQLRVHVQYSGLTNGSQYQLALNNDGTSPAWHADFEMGWLPGTLERIIANCINAGKECKQDVNI